MEIDIEEKGKSMKNQKRKRKKEAVVREMQQRHQFQQRRSEQEKLEDEHSVFTHVRTMMNQIEQDKASITEIANQVTI